ncbi:hypothetical protein PsorP6_000638 [Peronosclerospora sorghi]|uniref:Uncharacterized protein n=1 Tax=Peronosclerospora sorghi TaxID=230839 RepID=A0ACC0WQY9_9STRA|nr:hypothetical protein PsorP6_000638 [Peronosclerospora sorghi]
MFSGYSHCFFLMRSASSSGLLILSSHGLVRSMEAHLSGSYFSKNKVPRGEDEMTRFEPNTARGSVCNSGGSSNPVSARCSKIPRKVVPNEALPRWRWSPLPDRRLSSFMGADTN